MKSEREDLIICMGSSCHSRGNRENLEIIQEFLAESNTESKKTFDLKGTLCCGKCSSGPHIKTEKGESVPASKQALEQWLRSQLIEQNIG